LKVDDDYDEIPGYYVTDSNTKREIEKTVRCLKARNQDYMSRFPDDANHVIFKVLLYGPSGAGKNQLAKELGRLYLNDPKQTISEPLKCNMIEHKGNPDVVADMIKDFIKTNKGGVAIIDEIDKITPIGQEVHDKLLGIFADWEGKVLPASKKTLVILICSLRKEEIQSLEEGKRIKDNLADLYTRFQLSIYLPSLVERPLDAVKIFASILLKKGVHSASLTGLLAVAAKEYPNARMILADASNVVSKSADVYAAATDAFTAANLSFKEFPVDDSINISIRGSR
jgi:Cdc6-like AAA superfamily ATPase